MKKLSILTISILISSISFGQGFETNKLRLGAGLFFASDINNVGLTLNSAYEINYDWEAAVAFTHFFEKDYVTWNILDLDAHYIFYTDEGKFNAYGIAGLSISFVKVTIPEMNVGGIIIPESTGKDSSAGFNIGAGINYGLSDKLNLAPEFRITLADGSYVRIGATVQYLF